VNETICPPGNFCKGGYKSPCTKAGDVCLEGAALPSPCPQGSFCPSTDEQIACMGTQSCPESSTAPDPCPDGSYCAGGQQLECPTTPGVACFNGEIISAYGSYLNTTNTANAASTLIPCEAGNYCLGRQQIPCDTGTYSARASAASCFICPPGKHTQDEGNVECEPCPFQGVNCTRYDGKPDVEPGFWRFNDDSPILETTEFYACPACEIADDAAGLFADNENEPFNTKFQCRDGHDKTVPVCGACLEDYWKKGDGCIACGLSSGSPETDIFSICLVIIFVILIGLGFKFRKILKKYGAAVNSQSKHHKVFAARMIVLYQILKSISDVYRLDENGGYPESYTAYIQNPFFALLSLDIFGSWSCAGFDFYDELLITTLLPTGILCICLFRGRLPKLDNETVESFGYFVATVSLVPISTVVFKTFSCSEYQVGQVLKGDDFHYIFENRLRANLRVDCDSEQHFGYEVFAGIMLCLWPLGVPLLGVLLLLSNTEDINTYLVLREQLEVDDGTEKIVALIEAPKQIKMFKGLFEHFRSDFYWWGVLDMLYGLLLTGFAVLFAPGSMMQITLGFLIGHGYYVLQLSCRPYRSTYHNFMVALVNLNVTLTIFASLLLKVDSEMGASLVYEAGYNILSISIFLILCNMIIVFEFLGYSKRAIELATAVVIVKTSKSDLAMGAEEAAKAADAAATGSSAIEGIDNKAAESKAMKMGSVVKKTLKKLTTFTKKQEKKDSVDPALIVEGFYFPRVLNGNVWGPFPHTNTYQGVYNFILWCAHHIYVQLCCSGRNAKQRSSDSEGADAKVKSNDEGANHSGSDGLKTKNIPEAGLHPGVTSWSLFWDVTVYVNDTSGWVLRRTSLGWEIAPNMSADAKFVAKSDTPLPPKSGWESVEASSMVNISSINVPLRWQGRPAMQIPDLTADAGPSVFINPGAVNTKRGSMGDGGLPRASPQPEISIELTQLSPN